MYLTNKYFTSFDKQYRKCQLKQNFQEKKKAQHYGSLQITYVVLHVLQKNNDRNIFV